MPLNVQFTRKGATEPTPLNQIDEELCALLGKPVDPNTYVEFWLDFIGQWAALDEYHLGTQALRDKVGSFDMPDLVTILNYLEENYTSYGWRGISKT